MPPTTYERVRSPSPYRKRSRSRSRSPRPESSKHRKHRTRSPPKASSKAPPPLPYKARKLSKHQYDEYRPLFQSYLDIQKKINLDDLDEREARGRWKSFVSHWNRGDLARSWYDPSMLKTAQETVSEYRASSPASKTKRASPTYESAKKPEPDADSDSDDDFGPAAPKHLTPRRTGPTIPKLDDLALRDEQIQEERARQSLNYRDDIRFERKTDRKAHKERLDELVPRADPGSRERQLEKKRETTTALQGFRDAKESGDVEVPESDLMGDDGDAYKRNKSDFERKKNEREIRKEEILRARAEEREERMSVIRQKEAATMEYLHAIAKERFG